VIVSVSAYKMARSNKDIVVYSPVPCFLWFRPARPMGKCDAAGVGCGSRWALAFVIAYPMLCSTPFQQAPWRAGACSYDIDARGLEISSAAMPDRCRSAK